nr:WD40 repeat domain-containing protein [Candidatus Sigynarchaeum springense]
MAEMKDVPGAAPNPVEAIWDPVAMGFPHGYSKIILEARKCRGRFPTHELDNRLARRMTGVLTPDRKFIVASIEDGVEIRDVTTGEHVRTCEFGEPFTIPCCPQPHHTPRVRSLAISPFNQAIVAGCDTGDIYCWDFATGTINWRKDGRKSSLIQGGDGPREGHGRSPSPSFSAPAVVAASPDGRLVASSGADGHVRAWDVATGTMVADVDLAMAGRPFTPERTWTWYRRPDEPTPTFYPPYTNMVFYDHKWDVREHFCARTIAFAPDGSWIACGMNGGNKAVVDPVLAVDTHSWKAYSIGDFPSIGDRDWNVHGTEYPEYASIEMMLFTPDGKRLVTCAEEGARVYDAEEQPVGDGCRMRLRHDGRVTGYDFHADPRTDYPMTTRGIAFLPKARSGRERSTLLLVEHNHGFLECVDIDDDRHGENPIFVLFRDSKNLGFKVSCEGQWIHFGVLYDLGEQPLEDAQ